MEKGENIHLQKGENKQIAQNNFLLHLIVTLAIK